MEREVLIDDGDNIAEQVGEALRETHSAATTEEKLASLKKAEELLLTRDIAGHLLDNFLDEMLEFAQSTDPHLKSFVAGFIEHACQRDAEVMKKAITCLSTLITTGGDGQIRVMKKVMVVCSNLYPVILKWAIKKRSDVDAERCWEAFSVLKGRIMQNIETDNSGIRTMTLKFLESIVLTQTLKSEYSEPGRGDLMNLSEVPRDHRFISYRKLQAESNYSMQVLIDQTSLSHISATNLVATVHVLCNICRQRPEFMTKVLDALEALNVNLPPTLGTGQVKSVRKELRMHLLRLLKHRMAIPLHPRISTLLTELGASLNEIQRAIPQEIQELKRKAKKAEEDGTSGPAAKKPKQDADKLEDDEYGDEGAAKDKVGRISAIDVTTEYFHERLTPTLVTNLLMISLMTLPEEMPPAFASTYTPIAAAGTENQKRHVARMMATQATQEGLGPGVEQMRQEKLALQNERQAARREGVIIPPTPAVHVGGHGAGAEFKAPKPISKPAEAAPVQQKGKQQFALIADTKEPTEEELNELFKVLFTRIMWAERRIVQGGAAAIHQQLLVRLASRFFTASTEYESMMIDFIIEEHKSRTDLALLWVAELYAQFQGFSRCMAFDCDKELAPEEQRLGRYDRVVCGILSKLHMGNQHKEALFHKLLLEAPLVTSNALQWLKTACLDTVFGAFGMTTLRELILTRNRQREELLDLLFQFAFFDDRTELRQSTVETVKELCELSYMREDVARKLAGQLEYCSHETPPPFFLPYNDPTELAWNEDVYKNALHIYLAVLPLIDSLLLPLAQSFSAAPNVFKRIIMRSLDQAVKTIGIHSASMLQLVDECPIGAEALIARVILLITERHTVTRELVTCVKRLYDERNLDVRSLVPVLNGLTKGEVLDILPRFLMNAQSQKSVEHVYKKVLIARQIETGEPVLSATELIREYHRIYDECAKTAEEKKILISNLDDLLKSRNMTKENVAAAIEALLESEKVSTLFYTTLAKIYNTYHSLDGFLGRVISKIIRRELYKQDDEGKKAFYKALSTLKSVAYTSLLTDFSAEEFTDYMGSLTDRQRNDVSRLLREHFPSLSNQQKKDIDSTVLDMIGVNNDENRDKDAEKDIERQKTREEKRTREKEREQRRKSSRR